jgi:uncharacterized membrane protein
MIAYFESLEESTEIVAPPSAVFAQWTHFEDFPKFMEGVEEVRQTGTRKIHWRGKFEGVFREWDSEITVWIPEHRLAWRATSAGAHSSRAIQMERTESGNTLLTMAMLIDPNEEWAHLPSTKAIAQRLQADLARFKSLIESSSTGHCAS